MLRPSFLAFLLLLPVTALAADASAPVSEVMAAAKNNWQDMGSGADTPPPYIDYFSEDFLSRLYSRDFVAKYRAAAKYPAYDDGASPFGYDPIVGGQDGCPLEDLTIRQGASSGATTDVAVSFDNLRCFDGADATPTELVFKVKEEDGRPVIDDMVRPGFDDIGSLKDELVDLVRYGEEMANERDGAAPAGQE